jgi:hypothetical protein
VGQESEAMEACKGEKITKERRTMTMRKIVRLVPWLILAVIWIGVIGYAISNFP